MKNRLLTLLAVTAFSTGVFAQKTLSIDEAWQSSIENNVKYKIAKIDRTIADQKVK